MSENNKDVDCFSAQFDYAIVLPIDKNVLGNENNKDVKCFDNNEALPISTKFIILALLEAGLEIYNFLSVQNDELIVLVKCPVSSLLTLFI
jgi:hypothetical protein